MSILAASKNLGIKHNVSFRVLDANTHEVIQEHTGHNAATNSMLTGIAHYLIGDGVLNQGSYMLSNYVPRYISLGTMGLLNQDEDDDGLPAGIGVTAGDEIDRFLDYMSQVPGYGADGYDQYENNDRDLFGLGPAYTEDVPIKCELISSSFPRTPISFRDVVPETESELPETIDVVFSAMISTGALAQFRNGNDYIFITEAGLWSKPDWSDGSNNGLLAGYRITPPNQDNWDMVISENRDILKQQILRVGINQVVQIIWKIQIGAIEQLFGYGGGEPDDTIIAVSNVIMPEAELYVLEYIKTANTNYPDKTREECFWAVHHPSLTTYEQFSAYILSLEDDDDNQLYPSVDAYCESFTDGMLGYTEFIEVANKYNNQMPIRYNVDLNVTRKLKFTSYIPGGVIVTDSINLVSDTVAVDISCNLSGGVLTYYSADRSTIYVSANGKVVAPSNLRREFFDVYITGNTSTARRTKEIDFNSSFNTIRLSSVSWFSNQTDYEYINVAGLNLSNVQLLNEWFEGCTNLKTVDGLVSINTSNITNMESMFEGCTSLTDLDLSRLNTSNVTRMYKMFKNCTSLPIIDISGFDLTNVNYLDNMFENCTELQSIRMPEHRVSSPKYWDVMSMFRNCTSLRHLDLSHFNTSLVNHFSHMFQECHSLQSINFTDFNTSNAVLMDYMFEDCSSLVVLDLSSFNTSKVRDMTSMFTGCASLQSVNLSSFNTPRLGYGNSNYGTYRMFYGCTSLTTVDLSGFNTGQVHFFGDMFWNCSSLSSVNLSSFTTAAAYDYGSMFEGCSSLTSLYLPGFENMRALPPFVTSNYMFKGTTSLNTVYVTNGRWNISQNPANIFENSSGHMEYIP